MTKPHIAVCISGQPRSWQKGWQYIAKNLLSRDDIECDVYIHTWYYDFINYGDLIDHYKPKRILIEQELDERAFEPYEDIVAKDKPLPYGYSALVSVNHPAKFTVSSFYSIAKVAELSEITPYCHDYAVRLRFDYALNDRINFSNVEYGKIYVPNCRLLPERNFCNDQFAYGTWYDVNKYSCTYWHMKDFFKDGTMMCGEDMLAANLKFYNLIGENMVYVDMKNPFPPGEYNGTWHSLIRDDMDLWKPDARISR